jgi:hypothetical protein
MRETLKTPQIGGPRCSSIAGVIPVRNSNPEKRSLRLRRLSGACGHLIQTVLTYSRYGNSRLEHRVHSLGIPVFGYISACASPEDAPPLVET